MTQVIWKAVLEATSFQEIKVPQGTVFLCAGEQYEDICVWYRCDPEAPLVKRSLYIYGTGHEMELTDIHYLGTTSLAGGKLIFHVFEKIQ